MKAILFIFFLVAPLLAQAQQVDTTYQQMQLLKRNISDLDNKIREGGAELRTFGSNYYTGVAMQLVGIVGGGIAGALGLNARQGSAVNTTPIAIAGGALLLAGSVEIIISHRHIKMAGRRFTRNF